MHASWPWICTPKFGVHPYPLSHEEIACTCRHGVSSDAAHIWSGQLDDQLVWIHGRSYKFAQADAGLHNDDAVLALELVHQHELVHNNSGPPSDHRDRATHTDGAQAAQWWRYYFLCVCNNAGWFTNCRDFELPAHEIKTEAFHTCQAIGAIGEAASWATWRSTRLRLHMHEAKRESSSQKSLR